MSRINATTITGLSGEAPTFTNGVNVTGVITATTFRGNVTGNVTGNSTGLAGTPNITVGIVTASSIRNSVTSTAIGKTLVNREFCSVTADSITINLPASPSVGWEVSINNTSTFTNITIGRNGELLMGLSENMTFDVSYATLSLLYVSNSVGWRII
jgi:hypothetical protein